MCCREDRVAHRSTSDKLFLGERREMTSTVRFQTTDASSASRVNNDEERDEEEEEELKGGGGSGGGSGGGGGSVKMWGFVDLVEHLLLHHDAPASRTDLDSQYSTFSSIAESQLDEDDEDEEEWRRRVAWEEDRYRSWLDGTRRDDEIGVEERAVMEVQRVAQLIHEDFRREVEDESMNIQRNVTRGIRKMADKWPSNLFV